MIGVIFKIEIAEIINPNHFMFFRFLETVCINRGFKFALFYERQEALEWLLD